MKHPFRIKGSKKKRKTPTSVYRSSAASIPIVVMAFSCWGLKEVVAVAALSPFFSIDMPVVLFIRLARSGELL